MNCKKCGEHLEDSWKICPKCGEPVGGTNLQSDISEKKVKKAVYKKWWFWLIIVLAVFVGLAIYGGSLPEEKEEKPKTQVKEVKDFSQHDLEDLMGKSEKDVLEMGLVKGEEPSEYEGLDGNIKIAYKDKKLSSILIQGDEEATPSFHGVRIGMGKEEVQDKLKDSYPEVTGNDTDMEFLNLDTKGSVHCKIADGKTKSITFSLISQEQVAQYKKAQEEVLRAEYIFPDSDSKYLSEDEVRAVEADKLFIGRNEIFARHGYIFEDEGLKQHFGNTSWYKGTVQGNQFNADEVFNDFEKKNVELIKKIEDEISGKAAEDVEKKAAIDGAYNFVAGKSFHLKDTQLSVEFTTSGEFIAIGYYATYPELENKYCNYTFSAQYMENKDTWQYLTFVTIEGVEYYFRYFENGDINLSGDGEFDGWYESL